MCVCVCVCCRYTKSGTQLTGEKNLELPELHINTVMVPWDNTEKGYYEHLAEGYREDADDYVRNVSQSLALLTLCAVLGFVCLSLCGPIPMTHCDSMTQCKSLFHSCFCPCYHSLGIPLHLFHCDMREGIFIVAVSLCRMTVLTGASDPGVARYTG